MNSEAGHTVDLSRPFQLGRAYVDPQHMTIEIAEEIHHLTDLTWRFLMQLVTSAPEIVSYDSLATSVWQQDHVSDETIAQRLRQLRKILGDDPKKPTYIRTVRGKGYQLIARLTALHSEPMPAHPEGWLRGKAMGAALAALGVLAVMTWLAIDRARTPQSPPASSQASATELISRADEYRTRGQNAANETAIQLYEKALDVVPNNQRALIGLSFSYAHRASKFEQSADWAEKAATLADKAILNDPGSAAAFAARGLADDAQGKVSSALGYYRKSLELDPSDQSIRSSAAYLLQVQGHFHEALTLEKQALDAAAPTYFADYQIALALGGAGLDQAAQSWGDRASLLRPDIVFLTEYKARELITARDFSGAIDFLSQETPLRLEAQNLRTTAFVLNEQPLEAIESNQDAILMAQRRNQTCYACVSFALRRGGAPNHAAARLLIAASGGAIAEGDEWPQYRISLAYLHTALGEEDLAMIALGQAYDLGYRDWQWLGLTPHLDGLKGRLDFKALVLKMRQSSEAEKQKILADRQLRSFVDNKTP